MILYYLIHQKSQCHPTIVNPFGSVARTTKVDNEVVKILLLIKNYPQKSPQTHLQHKKKRTNGAAGIE